MKRRRIPDRRAIRENDQQASWLSSTALCAGVYGLLTWIVGTFVSSSWSLDRTTAMTPIVGLTTTFTVINVLWGVALLVDLLNASRSAGRVRAAWMAGTVLALVLVALAQAAVSNMRLAAGG